MGLSKSLILTLTLTLTLSISGISLLLAKDEGAQFMRIRLEIMRIEHGGRSQLAIIILASYNRENNVHRRFSLLMGFSLLPLRVLYNAN